MGIHSNTWWYMAILVIQGDTWAYIVRHGDRWGYIVIHGDIIVIVIHGII